MIKFYLITTKSESIASINNQIIRGDLHGKCLTLRSL